MPELPEVETTRRGVAPHLVGQRIEAVEVRERRLRWPVARDFEATLEGQPVAAVRRRAKYLLVDTAEATAIVHLGMSGSLRLATPDTPLRPHDHVRFVLSSGRELRFHDPRRFGSMHVCADASSHALIRDLGPEPLGNDFDGAYLHARARGRRVAIKNLIMNANVVVGVGNIYASESLFVAGIHPARAAGRISRARIDALAEAIRVILGDAIECGGTTLRDFVDSNGQPGYFAQTLNVYGRSGETCRHCGECVRSRVIGQRSTFFCVRCQR